MTKETIIKDARECIDKLEAYHKEEKPLIEDGSRLKEKSQGNGNIFCVKHNINVLGYCRKCNQEANEKMWEAVNKLDDKFINDNTYTRNA